MVFFGPEMGETQRFGHPSQNLTLPKVKAPAMSIVQHGNPSQTHAGKSAVNLTAPLSLTIIWFIKLEVLYGKGSLNEFIKL